MKNIILDLSVYILYTSNYRNCRGDGIKQINVYLFTLHRKNVYTQNLDGFADGVYFFKT